MHVRVLIVVATFLVGCNSGGRTAVDGGPDGRADTGIEAPADTGADRPADAGSDAPADTGSDAPADTGSDAPADVPADVGMEVAAEAGPEVMPEAGADAPAACQTIPMTATLTSHLRITADNECEVFVNGSSVGMTTNWGSPVTIDVTLFVHPGRRNVIAVRGTNTSSQDGPDRGIIGQLTVDSDGGVAPLVITDAAWRTSMSVPDVDAGAASWTALDFDDSAWSMATEVGSNGDAPWGAVFGTSVAKWIWSAPIPTSTSAKPNLETTYARRTFYFGLDGSSISSTPACP
jgi:hypothetical protein